MVHGLITDSSPARWSDPTHEVNWEIDANIMFHISDSVNPFFFGGGGGGGGAGGGGEVKKAKRIW